MNRIRIDNAWTAPSGTIAMWVTRDIEETGEMVEETTTMASGKLVTDVKGYRKQWIARWDWFPASSYELVLPILRSGKFFPVRFTDEAGEDFSVVCKLEPENHATIFKYVGETPMWHNIGIRFTAQEVTKYE